MPAHSEAVVCAFRDLCQWVHDVWLTHRTFQAGVAEVGESVRARHAHLLGRLGILSQEYTLLQISKLHDPAVQQNSINLTLGYMLEYGAWSADVRAELSRLKASLDVLGTRLKKTARNKVLCHNDLAAFLAGDALGSFESGLDDHYFADLERFVNLVHEQVLGSPYEWNTEAQGDVQSLLHALDRRYGRVAGRSGAV